jgi:hypothetical protein
MKKYLKFVIVFFIAFILNAVWEFLHYRLYFDLSGISKYPHLLLATFTDAIIITIIFLIISLKNKNIKWINKPKKLDYLLIILFGLIVAIFIEIRALKIERWAYKEIMPTIFGVGLSPLMQLAVTGVLSLILVKHYLSFKKQISQIKVLK